MIKNYFKIDENSCRVEIIKQNIINDYISICEIKRLVKNGKYIPELDNLKSKEYLKIRNQDILFSFYNYLFFKVNVVMKTINHTAITIATSIE